MSIRPDAVPAAAAQPSGPLRRWIVEHDDSWLFTVAYVGLALVLSIWISLFWLVAVVAVHFVLEWVRQKYIAPPGSNIVALAGWEIKLDIALILFALALTAYMDILLGLAGLGGAARIGARGAARVGGWGRAIKATLLSLDDAAQVARLALSKLSKPNPATPSAYRAAESGETAEAGTDISAHQKNPMHWRAWSRGDRVTVAFGMICIAAIFSAPWLTEHTFASLAEALLSDLHPFPPE